MADIFSTDNDGNNEPLDLGLNDLVGEGKKYKTPDELAKAYANIERHARTLEGENAQVRAKLDILEANPPKQDDNGGEPPEGGDNRQPAPNNAPKPNEVDFRSQIREEVQALNQQERAAANIEAAAQEMVKHFGDSAKANEAVIRRAGELGVSVEWLRDSASRSPAAFLATMGISNETSHSTPAPRGSGNIDSTVNGNIRNFEYYDKLRKENPKLYFSAATQTEMMNQARTQGSDFYKR
jgi:hypothetical protein